MRPFDDAALERLRVLLAGTAANEIELGDLRRACVVIPIVRVDAGWTVLFSRRSADLPVHSGQISFPGGGVKEGEALEDGALREMEEEVGVPRDRVELIGRLDDVVTRTGFLVAPFVGVVRTRIEYVLQASEVVEVFEVPIHALLEPQHPEIRYMTYRDTVYPVYFYCHDGIEIWGLTARMLKTFLDFVRLAL